MSGIKGRDPIAQLYRAVERYVNSRGGNLVVVGGVHMLEDTLERTGNFSIAIHCTGQKPVFTQPKSKPKGSA